MGGFVRSSIGKTYGKAPVRNGSENDDQNQGTNVKRVTTDKRGVTVLAQFLGLFHASSSLECSLQRYCDPDRM